MYPTVHRTSRRSLLRNGSLILLSAGVDLRQSARLLADQPTDPPLVRVGLLTDLHFADKPSRGTRHYRETLAKLEEAAGQFEQDRPEIVVELGDFIDAADSVQVERQYLTRIHQAFAELPGKKHYVLGNHCVDTLTKEEFLAGVGQQQSYYSFDQGGVHFVVLDACFRGDGLPYGRRNFQWTDANIPDSECAWLRDDLLASDTPTIVFAHQRLDVANNYGVRNAPQVRKILENAGRVAAVFQGHSHKNDYHEIGGIHYCTLAAMVEGSGAENSGYGVLDVFPSGAMRVSGFRKQANYDWK